MADPVSWLVVQRGWSVVGADGDELGSVDEVLGDEDTDIFNGLTVLHGMVSRPRYVPAERVRAIREGAVELDLDRAAFERLEPYEPPAAG
jgi:PRC-barrel domain protein